MSTSARVFHGFDNALVVTSETELDTQPLNLRDYLAILRRRKKELLIPAATILIVGLLAAMLLPPVYRSEATILIEQQEIPAEMVQSTVTSYAGERIQIISQRVMTTANLGKIIDEYGLYVDERETSSLTTLVEDMREDISLKMISADVVDPRSGRPTTATIAFTLGFSHKDPRTAQRIASQLTSLFLEENVKQRTEAAVETTSFMQVEANRLEAEVVKLEAELASFKEKNINNLPEMTQLNIQLMERADRDLDDIKKSIRALEERTIYLRSELLRINPTNDLYSTDGKRVLSSRDRLKALQTEFLSLSARYSAAHPDLVNVSSEIDLLKQEVGKVADVNEIRRKLTESQTELSALSKRYSSQHPDVIKQQRLVAAAQVELANASRSERIDTDGDVDADNPAYIEIKAQLTAAETELDSYRRLRDETRAKVADFEQRLAASPKVELEYRELTRDYDNALARYNEVMSKQLGAELATALERENKGERFSLLEPPVVPEKPEKPNRLVVALLGFMLSLGSGMGVVAVTESLNKSITSPKELVAITNGPPLIIVPYIDTEGEIAKRQLWRRYGLVILVLGGALLVIIVHYVLIPLDVLGYVVSRKLGLPQ